MCRNCVWFICLAQSSVVPVWVQMIWLQTIWLHTSGIVYFAPNPSGRMISEIYRMFSVYIRIDLVNRRGSYSRRTSRKLIDAITKILNNVNANLISRTRFVENKITTEISDAFSCAQLCLGSVARPALFVTTPTTSWHLFLVVHFLDDSTLCRCGLLYIRPWVYS